MDSSNYIGPQDAVHPYLLFRGCDIKDLHVHESRPKPEETTAVQTAKTSDSNATVSDEMGKQPQLDSAIDGTKSSKVDQDAGGGNNGSINSKKSKKSNPSHQVGTGASLLARKARGSVPAGM